MTCFYCILKDILKFCIKDENTDGITCQLEIQFSSMNIFSVRSTIKVE